MATTLCVLNQKGGCGKSSTCFHLAGAFAGEGMEVLLVDVDPQGSLSKGFFGSIKVENLTRDQTTALLFDEQSFFAGRGHLVRSTGIDRISLVPANQELLAFNTPQPESKGMQNGVLREFLEDHASQFDVVLIDCPPNLYRCSWAAMVAASHALIPVEPDDFGTHGLRAVHQMIQQARVLNSRLRRLGHLVTRYDRRLLIHRLYEQRLRELYSDLVLDTVIPEATAFKGAVLERTPVGLHAPKTSAARLTRQLSHEILERTAGRASRRQGA